MSRLRAHLDSFARDLAGVQGLVPVDDAIVRRVRTRLLADRQPITPATVRAAARAAGNRLDDGKCMAVIRRLTGWSLELPAQTTLDILADFKVMTKRFDGRRYGRVNFPKHCVVRDYLLRRHGIRPPIPFRFQSRANASRNDDMIQHMAATLEQRARL